MKTGGAMLIIAVGLIALWVVVTGRLSSLERAWGVLNGDPAATAAASASGGVGDVLRGAAGDALGETIRGALGLPPKGVSNPFSPPPVPVFSSSSFS